MEIKHDEAQQRFYTAVDGEEAFTAYDREGDVLNFHHTFVPDKFRNNGVAGKVVTAALEYVKNNDLKIIASCAYVDQFLEKNKEYRDLIKKD